VRARVGALPATAATPGGRRLLALFERGLDPPRVKTQPRSRPVAEPDSAEFALMVIDVAPRDAELLGYRGGVDQPRGRRPRRVDDGVLDRADDAVADQVGEASRELVDDLRRQSLGLQRGLRWAGAR